MFDQVITAINSIYSPLSESTVQSLANYATIKSFQKGSTLVREGELARNLFYIVEGGAKAYYLKDGKNIADYFAFENNIICAFSSFYHKLPSEHYIETLEDSTIMVISDEHVQEMIVKHRDFETAIRIATTQTMLQLQRRIVSLQFESAQQKYINLLKEFPQIELRVPLTDIASFLGITKETLSRIRSHTKLI